MVYKLVSSSSLLTIITKEDSIFGGNYCIDPYQNCSFGCAYCDSAGESTIFVKHDAVSVLKKELSQVKKGVIIVGSVHDPYQPAEERYRLTKSLLEVIKSYDFPCHILTKSSLILRDSDLLAAMKSTVTVSLLSLSKEMSSIFEPNAPPPQERLTTVHRLREKGIVAGVALMPILPYITDDEIEETMQAIKESNACYCVSKHLELKGDQRRQFERLLATHFPHLIKRYKLLYGNRYTPSAHYLQHLQERIHQLSRSYHIPETIP